MKLLIVGMDRKVFLSNASDDGAYGFLRLP